MPLPQNKSAQAAQLLKDQIILGEYEQSLPSERVLSEKLLISRNCVREALAILTREGILAPPEQSRRREILNTQHSEVPKDITRCVILSPNAEHNSTEQFLAQLGRLQRLLSSSNIQVEVQSSHAFRSTSPDSQLEKLTASLPNTIWVLYLCTENIQKWFEGSGLISLIFGSPFPGVSLPSIDSDHTATVHHATGKLLQLGHRNIGLLLPRTYLAGAQRAEEGFQQTLEQSNHSPSSLILHHDFNLPRLTDTLTKIFSKKDAPTALIIQNSHHFLTVYSHLLSMKISIPEDVSLLSMAYSPSFDRLSPAPSCYTTGKKLILSLAHAIAHCSENRKPDIHLIPEFSKGSTLAAPAEPPRENLTAP